MLDSLTLFAQSSRHGLDNLFNSAGVIGLIVAIAALVAVVLMNLSTIRQQPSAEVAVPARWRNVLAGLLVIGSLVAIAGVWFSAADPSLPGRNNGKSQLARLLAEIDRQPVPELKESGLVMLTGGRVRQHKESIQVFLTSKPRPTRSEAVNDLTSQIEKIVRADFARQHPTSKAWNIPDALVRDKFLTLVAVEPRNFEFGGAVGTKSMYLAHADLELDDKVSSTLMPHYRGAVRGSRVRILLSAVIAICGVVVCIAFYVRRLASHRSKGVWKWSIAYAAGCFAVLLASVSTLPDHYAPLKYDPGTPYVESRA